MKIKVIFLLTLCATWCSAQTTVTVIPGTTYQTWHNWYALAMSGPGPNGAGMVAADPNWSTFEAQFWSAIVKELGINTLTIIAQSGDIENTQDYYTPNVVGNGSMAVWNAHRFTPVNDNANPAAFNCADASLVSCPAAFPLKQIDFEIETHWIGAAGMKAIAEMNGIQPHLSLTWVTNSTKADFTTTSPAEAAEHIAAIFIHCMNKYGIVPDILNIQNEPDLKSTWTPESLGMALRAVKDRLKALGFYPVIECCSTNSYASALPWYTRVRAVAGGGYIDAISSHNYFGTAKQIHSVWPYSNGVVYNTMNEHDGGNIADWFRLMQLAHISGYMRYEAGGYSSRNDGCPYIQVDSTVPFTYHYTIGNEGAGTCNSGPEYYFPQVMHYVREGAVVEGASSTSGAWAPVAFKGPGNLGQIIVIQTVATGNQTLNVAGLPAGTYSCTWTTRQNTIMAPCGPDQTVGNGGMLTTRQIIPPPEYPGLGYTTAVFTFFPAGAF